MSRTALDLDDGLLARAARVPGTATPAETVEKALREAPAVRRPSAASATPDRGSCGGSRGGSGRRA
ncbi:type II toxin-antitoxin system VapB family antitoxin [Kitasatospora sp. NPDC057965]|uniref:type II toxin-antitoxin system VapB family antitoxin n=1 Tax=Kitasatospora sp. NPDC057965 TaxID=3346291 RepID=UPI0036DF19BF